MKRNRTSSRTRLLGQACLLLLVFLAGTVGDAVAQYGKISGRVTDAANGEALPGVNVVIEGTTQGTSTNIDGEYVIIGVRPGTYTLVASYIGFQTQRIEGVRVQIDLTTSIDIQLREQVIEGEEVVVTATKPLVQKDLTATTSVVSGDEIRSLPLENFDDVVNQQAGVVNGHFRGGRLGEVAYLVDGLPVTDVFDGGRSVSIENNSVEELQVVTGAFNAEYGQALSGIVNVVTRDGSNEFSGNVSGFLGDYASTSSEFFPTTEVGDFGPADVRNVEANVSGPILKDRLFFFVSGRYFGNDGSIEGLNVFRPEDVGFGTSGRLDVVNPGGTGDSSRVALNPYEKMSGQAKLTWRATRSIRIAANLIASDETFNDYNHDRFYFPSAQLDKKRWARSSYLKWTHTLSNRTFYEAGVTNSYTAFRQWLYEDPQDPRYLDNNLFEFTDPLQTSNFRLGGTDNNRFSRSTNTWLVKADLTSQVNGVNLVKTGIEARFHTLDFNDDFVVVVRETDDQFISTNGRYRYQPFEFSAYIQDKIELGNLIINAGLRFDYFRSNGDIFRDPTDPEAVFLENRIDFQNITEDDVDEGGVPRGEIFRPDEHFEQAEAKYAISPRLGVAFPITEGGVIHFAYGQFFQVPNFENLYQNPYFLLGSGGSGLIGLVGNADLDPEQTINGEIGLKQELSATSAIELTAYYRDIRNLTGTATDPVTVRGTSARYGILRNSDFGFVRGVVLRYDQRFGSNFFASADYTYQVAKANASDPEQVFNAAAADQELETQIVSTNWDQRHTANVNVSYRNPTGWGFGVVGSFGSGEPYTPEQTTKQTGAILPTRIPLNSERKPITYTVDLDFYKNFDLFGGQSVQLFGRVINLLDRRNPVNVFADTGEATRSLQERVDAATFRGDRSFLERWYDRPDFFSEPRRVTLGLQYSF
ncbi:MAG: TonB-dependent receptor [Bacteroidetes bacterium]|jgi:outer membrane receptor protein involved in Fe transport|nr:TonB-dependent receptor [Bacteroidota bacterium]